MHGSSRNVFMCTALLALLLCAAARDFDADVNSMHAPVAHRRQESQELGRKLHKLEPTNVNDIFPPHGHPDPNASVGDDGFPPDLSASVRDDGFLQHGEVGRVWGNDKEGTEKDELILAQFTPAAKLFISADYDLSVVVVLGVIVIVIGVNALLFLVDVVCSFRRHPWCVSDSDALHSSCSHEQDEPEQEQEETEGEELKPVAPELVQPVRENVSRGVGFRTNNSVKRHSPQHSTFSNGHTRVQNAQQHPSLGGEVGRIQQNSLETIAKILLKAAETVSGRMQVGFSTAAETTATSSPASSPASPTTAGSTGMEIDNLDSGGGGSSGGDSVGGGRGVVDGGYLQIVNSTGVDSEKTSCLSALLREEIPNSVVVYIFRTKGLWAGEGHTAHFEGSPDWHALRVALQEIGGRNSGDSGGGGVGGVGGGSGWGGGESTPPPVGPTKKRRRSVDDDPPPDSSSDDGQKRHAVVAATSF